MREGKRKKGRRGEAWHTRTKRRWLFNIAPSHQNLQKEKGHRNKTQEIVCVLSLQPGLLPNSH